MNTDSIILEKHLKKTTIISNVVSVIAALITAIIAVNAFYYKTSITLEEHTEQINVIKNDVSKVRDGMHGAEVYQGASAEKMSGMKEKVDRLEEKVDKMNDKLDKILLQTK